MDVVFVGDWLPRTTLANSCIAESVMRIGNLECAIAAASRASYKAHPLVLGPEAIDRVAAARFTALNLANNHVYDAGGGCFADMLGELRRRCGTQFYGLKDSPYAVLEEKDRRCAVIGCLERCRARGPAIFREEDVLELIAGLRSRFDRVVVTPHWGKEGEFAAHPSPRQRALARRWIEAGADAVLGHHAHAVQGREWLRGRPVFYSLGNFVFDHDEGRAHRATSLGLAVHWSTGREPGVDRWRHELFLQHCGRVHALDARALQAAEAYFKVISDDLGDVRRPWGPLRWARTVGPIYIAKNRSSWRRRFRRHPLATVPVWLAWSMLPSTLLLRIGSLIPDKSTAVAAERFWEQLAENAMLRRDEQPDIVPFPKSSEEMRRSA